MYKIVSKRRLNETMTWLVIEAPLVARKAKPGQFIILRTDEHGERIPLTMAGHDSKKGTIDLIYAAKDDPGQAHFIERVESRQGVHTIEAAAELGIGSREYELVRL